MSMVIINKYKSMRNVINLYFNLILASS